MLNKSEQKRKDAKLDFICLIEKTPMSIKDIAIRLRINWRTCYRLLKDIQSDGFPIAKTDDHLYYLANNWPFVQALKSNEQSN